MSEATMNLMALLADLLVLAGALFFLISAVGLLRLPDFFCRIHAPTKAATMGVMLIGLGALIQSLAQGDLVWLEDAAILLFLFFTIPVSSQVLARAALRRGVRQVSRTTSGSRPRSR